MAITTPTATAPPTTKAQEHFVDLTPFAVIEDRSVRCDRPYRRHRLRSGPALALQVPATLWSLLIIAGVWANVKDGLDDQRELAGLLFGIQTLVGPARWVLLSLRDQLRALARRKALGQQYPPPSDEALSRHPIPSEAESPRSTALLQAALLFAAAALYYRPGAEVWVVLLVTPGLFLLVSWLARYRRRPLRGSLTLRSAPCPRAGPLQGTLRTEPSLAALTDATLQLRACEDSFFAQSREVSPYERQTWVSVDGTLHRRTHVTSFDVRKTQIWRSTVELGRALGGGRLPDELRFSIDLPDQSLMKEVHSTSPGAERPSYWELQLDATIDGRKRTWLFEVPVVGELDDAPASAKVPGPSPAPSPRSADAVGSGRTTAGGCGIQHDLDDKGQCRRCGGHLVSTGDVEAFAERRLQMSGADLRELAAQFVGGKVACPVCRATMNELPIKGVTVDLCSRCGSLWCDDGELARLENANR